MDKTKVVIERESIIERLYDLRGYVRPGIPVDGDEFLEFEAKVEALIKYINTAPVEQAGSSLPKLRYRKGI